MDEAIGDRDWHRWPLEPVDSWKEADRVRRRLTDIAGKKGYQLRTHIEHHGEGAHLVAFIVLKKKRGYRK